MTAGRWRNGRTRITKARRQKAHQERAAIKQKHKRIRKEKRQRRRILKRKSS